MSKMLYIEEEGGYSETFVASEKDRIVSYGWEVDELYLRDINVKPFRLFAPQSLRAMFLLKMPIIKVLILSFGNIRRFVSNVHIILIFLTNLQVVERKLNAVDHIRSHHLAKRTTFAMLAAIAFKIPYSAVAHADDIFNWDGSITEKIKNANVIHVISNYNCGYLNGKTRFRYSGKIDLIRNTFYRHKMDATRSYWNGKGTIRLVTIARFVESKGILSSLDILKEINRRNPVSFRLIGSGPLEGVIKNKILKEGLDFVELPGVLSISEIYMELMNAHFMLLLSRNASNRSPFMDGIPTVFFEALSTGLPVITTKVSGIPEIIQHGFNGLFVSEYESAAISARRLMEQFTKKRFDQDRIIDSLAQQLEELEGYKVLMSLVGQ